MTKKQEDSKALSSRKVKTPLLLCMAWSNQPSKKLQHVVKTIKPM